MTISYLDFKLDQTNWTGSEKLKAKEAMAYHFNVLDEATGALDTTDASALYELYQKDVFALLKKQYIKAQKYKASLLADELEDEV